MMDGLFSGNVEYTEQTFVRSFWATHAIVAFPNSSLTNQHGVEFVRLVCTQGFDLIRVLYVRSLPLQYVVGRDVTCCDLSYYSPSKEIKLTYDLSETHTTQVDSIRFVRIHTYTCLVLLVYCCTVVTMNENN